MDESAVNEHPYHPTTSSLQFHSNRCNGRDSPFCVLQLNERFAVNGFGVQSAATTYSTFCMIIYSTLSTRLTILILMFGCNDDVTISCSYCSHVCLRGIYSTTCALKFL